MINELEVKAENLIDNTEFSDRNAASSAAKDVDWKTKGLQIAGKGAKAILETYAEFARKHPILAEYGMSMLNIGVQTLSAGSIGLLNALRSEMTGFAMNAAAGEKIAEVFQISVDKSAKSLQDQFPGLEYEDAAALISLSAIAKLAASSGAGTIKQIFKKFDFKDMKKFDLHHHEGGAHGGHTLSAHTARTKEEMLKRIEERKKLYPEQNKFFESTYTDHKTVNEVLKTIVEKRSKEIDDWLKIAEVKDTKTFDHDFNKVIGYGIKNGEVDVSPRTKGRMVLEKTETGYSVKTGYPIE